MDRADVMVNRAQEVSLQAGGRVHHAQPALALRRDVLLHAEPPRPQVARRHQRAERVRLVAVVLAQHEGRVGGALIAQKVVPGAPDRLLVRREILYSGEKIRRDTGNAGQIRHTCTKNERKHVFTSSGIPLAPPISASQLSKLESSSGVNSGFQSSQIASGGMPNLV